MRHIVVGKCRWSPFFLAATATCWMAAAMPAAVCNETGEELFTDEFTELDPSLGTANDDLSVADGVLSYKQQKGYYWRSFYDALLFDDADAKIRVRLPDWGGDTDGVIGLAFWGANLNEYYILQISDAGTYSIGRATATSWTTPVPWRSTEAIKIEPGAWNELRVVTSGRRATIFINGKEMVRFRGRPPAKGSLFGLYNQANKAELVCEYSALKIVQGPPPAAGDATNDPTLLLSDDFETLDPAWGSEQGWFRVHDKHLSISFNSNESYKTLYSGDAFHEADATIQVRTVCDTTEGSPATGFIFWAKDYDEFYLLQLFADGTVCVARRVGGEWRYPLSARAPAAEAKVDPKGWTALRLATSGKRATVFVNGVKLASVPGQPPKGGWKLGLYGQSGETASESQFTELVVRKP